MDSIRVARLHCVILFYKIIYSWLKLITLHKEEKREII